MNGTQNNAPHESGQVHIEQCYMQPFLFFNADCMDIMKQYPDKYFDLAIVDPPYGLERFKKGGSHVNKYGSENGKWNNEKPNKSYFNELFRISKKQIIWGGNNFELPTSEYFIIWQKSNAEDFSFAMCEMAWTNCNVPAKVFTKLHAQVDEKRIHPTQKPTDLYDWIIKKYSKQGDKIIDTHLGSGSIALAIDKANKLDNMNLEFVGVELNSEFYNAALNRFRLAHAQSCLSF